MKKLKYEKYMKSKKKKRNKNQIKTKLVSWPVTAIDKRL